MAQLLTDTLGRFVLAGGRFLFASSVAQSGALPGGGTPQPGSPTTMALIDFYSTHQYARPVVQRRAGTEYGNVPVLFNYTGTAPGNPQARVVNAVGGAVVKDWTTLTDINVTGTSGVGTLPAVPQGGYYLLELRDGHNPATSATNSAGTKQWGVGVCFLGVGQSNWIGTLDTGSYLDIVPGSSPSQHEYDYWFGGKSGGTQFGTSGFIQPGGSDGSDVPTLSRGTMSTMRIVSARLSAKYGKLIPVAFIPWGFGSKSIGELSPDGSFSTALFNGAGTTSGSIGLKSPGNIYAGDFEGLVWHQGEGDSGNSRAVYLQALKDLYNNLLARVAPFGRTAQHLFFLPAILGKYTAGTSGIEGKRGSVLDLEAYAIANNWPKVRAGWNCIDLDPSFPGTDENSGSTNADGLHFRDIVGGPKFRKWSCGRMQQAILWALECSTATGAGPRIASITRSGDVLTATITHDGGTSLTTRTGGAITGWTVNGGAISPTVAIASANTVTLTLPGGTTYPVTVQCGGGMTPDVSNPIVDNFAYPEGATGTDLITNGRPIVPTPDPITVN